jgi:Domain of unknown function (DUF1707)
LIAPPDTGPGSPGGGRRLLSDRDREQLVELLAQHSAQGRLNIDELERRVTAVYEAQSREDVAPLIADLPPLATEPKQRRWGRGHGEATDPGIGWVATDERFRDPSTQRIMRVWVDPSSGTRHYVPDQAD